MGDVLMGMIMIDPDCLACATCGELIGRGPYALTASNAVVHPECVSTATPEQRQNQ
jgi:hypothetical protein